MSLARHVRKKQSSTSLKMTVSVWSVVPFKKWLKIPILQSNQTWRNCICFCFCFLLFAICFFAFFAFAKNSHMRTFGARSKSKGINCSIISKIHKDKNPLKWRSYLVYDTEIWTPQQSNLGWSLQKCFRNESFPGLGCELAGTLPWLWGRWNPQGCQDQPVLSQGSCPVEPPGTLEAACIPIHLRHH